jgi:hypothetical protein
MNTRPVFSSIAIVRDRAQRHEGVGVLLLDDRQRAVAVRRKDALAHRIEHCAVVVFSDRERGKLPAAVGIDDDECFIGAGHEEPPCLAIERDAVRPLAALKRPVGIHLVRGRVDAHKLVVPGTVDEERALAVRHAELKTATAVDGRE